ncbi:MAG: PIN domain-containing protein [Verrucomicrobiota bacterium]
MLSIDTHIFLHDFNEDSPRQEAAIRWLESIAKEEAVAISEFILAEFSGLLRNPVVLKYPLSAEEAVEVVQVYRNHPLWRLIGFPTESRSLHDSLWQKAWGQRFRLPEALRRPLRLDLDPPRGHRLRDGQCQRLHRFGLPEGLESAGRLSEDPTSDVRRS